MLNSLTAFENPFFCLPQKGIVQGNGGPQEIVRGEIIIYLSISSLFKISEAWDKSNWKRNVAN
jgi:hypothetical protein